ncbi:MAG TPA: hypothetical protein VFM14_06335 [Gemmatimonadales bacterium]|nr:hypothetical protein [Gemmatimonadales bacterium]
MLATLAVATFAIPGGAQQTKVNNDRKLITAAEIAEIGVISAYDAVQRLRSDWLRAGSRRITVHGRTGSTDTPVGPSAGGLPAASTKLVVFVDGTEIGGPEELQRLQCNDIEEIRYLNGSDAQQQYGSRFSAGVIQVKLRHS